MLHACADRYSHLKTRFFLTHPTPGEVSEPNPDVAMCVVVWLVGCVVVWVIHLLISGHDRQTAPKFGTNVRIDTLTLKKKCLTHPTPGGFRGLNCLARLALARERTPSIIKVN